MDNPVSAFLFSAIGSGIIWYLFFWGADCTTPELGRFGLHGAQTGTSAVSSGTVCSNMLGMKGSAVGQIDLAEATVICGIIGILVGGIVSIYKSRSAPGAAS